jgi:hypothetical protein
MEAASLLLSFLMVYHQLLQEVCDMVCCLVAHSSLIGNDHLQSSNASETFSLEPGKKDKLSEEEMLAKKVEAAQRRKMQVEKATKESEVGEVKHFYLLRKL